jgi:hypothetical protein
MAMCIASRYDMRFAFASMVFVDLDCDKKINQKLSGLFHPS